MQSLFEILRDLPHPLPPVCNDVIISTYSQKIVYKNLTIMQRNVKGESLSELIGKFLKNLSGTSWSQTQKRTITPLPTKIDENVLFFALVLTING